MFRRPEASSRTPWYHIDHYRGPSASGQGALQHASSAHQYGEMLQRNHTVVLSYLRGEKKVGAVDAPRSVPRGEIKEYNYETRYSY